MTSIIRIKRTDVTVQQILPDCLVHILNKCRSNNRLCHCDRIIHTAHRIGLKGDFVGKSNRSPNYPIMDFYIKVYKKQSR